jgi:predicted O-methyltransferase YrrM
MKDFEHFLAKAVFAGMDGEAKHTGSDMAGHMPTLALLARISCGPIVECGVGKGFSTIALLLGACSQRQHVTSIDCDPECEQRMLSNIGPNATETTSVLLRNHWTFRVGDSVKAADEWESNMLGLFFLDTSHRYEATLQELGAWLPKLKDGGIMCGHDYYLEGAGVQRAVQDFMGLVPERFRLQVCRHDQGLFILWPRLQK